MGPPPTPRSTSIPPLIPITHDLLHDAIERGDINRVSSLLFDLKLKPCYLNPLENCFTLAQIYSNTEALKFLLTHCCAGIHAIYSNGDTLLIRDIKLHGSKNFHILTEAIGLDVDQYNLDGFTALHYATLLKDTPIEVIRKLIELKADVNKKARYLGEYDINNELLYELRDATPLICLLQSYDENNGGLEKVQLLINNGARVDVVTKDGCTALMYAAKIDVHLSSNMGLMNCLFDHGAIAGLTNDLNENALTYLISTLGTLKFSLEDTEELINNYYIRIFELLINKGDDPFICPHKTGSLFYGIVDAFKNNKNVKKFILYFAKKQFQILFESTIKPIHLSNNRQIYPLEPIVKACHSLVTDQDLLEELLHFIILCPIIECKRYIPSTRNDRIQITEKLQWRFPRLDKYYTDAKYHNVSSVVVKCMALNKLENTLEMLRNNHFHFNGDELCLLLVRIIMQKEEDQETMLQLFDYFIRNLDTYTRNFSKDLLATSPVFNTRIQRVDIPDSAWLAALTGNVALLKKFFPYCVSHPLAIILLLHPYIEKGEIEILILDTIDIIFPALSSTEYTVSDDIKKSIDAYMQKIRYRAFGQNTIPSNKKEKYAKIYGTYLEYRQLWSNSPLDS